MSTRKRLAGVPCVVTPLFPDVQRTNTSCYSPSAQPVQYDSRYRSALLSRLLGHGGGGGQGTLHCHPEQWADITHWITQHPHLGWRLIPDATLRVGEVKLVTAQHEFRLRWQPGSDVGAS